MHSLCALCLYAVALSIVNTCTHHTTCNNLIFCAEPQKPTSTPNSSARFDVYSQFVVSKKKYCKEFVKAPTKTEPTLNPVLF